MYDGQEGDQNNVFFQPPIDLEDNSQYVVQKEKSNRCRSNLVGMRIAGLLVVPDENGDEKVAEGLTSSRKDHHVPSTPFLDIRNTDQ